MIDGVRLAETLSALKDGLAPTLADLHDAAVTLLGHGELTTVKDALRPRRRRHGDRRTAQGRQPDFDPERLRARADAAEAREIQDDRQAGADARSARESPRRRPRRRRFSIWPARRFFIACACWRFGSPSRAATRQQSTTWAEKWNLQWTPESEIALVEAVLLGETVELATAYKFKTQLEKCTSIAEAAAMVRDACQCGLMKSMELARRRLQELAADEQRVRRASPTPPGN